MLPSFSPPLPLDEAARLEALRPYQVLSTMQDDTFAELVRLTAKLFQVPICILALVEEEVVRFDLNHGLPAGLTHARRDQTLCSVALLQEGVSVFPNLHDEPCTLINPALVQQLQLGFYAGYTLRTPAGFPIGVLCVIDYRARAFDPAETALLEQLAGVVMGLLNLRVALAQRPCWNRDLWADVYARIEVSIARLDALAALTEWQPAPTDNPGRSQQTVVREEMRRIVEVLLEHVETARGCTPVF